MTERTGRKLGKKHVSYIYPDDILQEQRCFEMEYWNISHSKRHEGKP